MNPYQHIFVLASVICFCGCDPALTGSLKVYNDTGEKLTVAYFDASHQNADTIVKEIPPNSSADVKVLNGLGNKKEADCCPCQLSMIKVYTPAGTIKKDPGNTDNWIIPNKSKLKKFGKEPVKCEFHVRPSDL